jgi:hypothetical protein
MPGRSCGKERGGDGPLPEWYTRPVTLSLRAPGCENATRAARRLPRIRAILLQPHRSQDHGHHSFAAALVDYLQANFDRAWQERQA